MQHPLYIIAAVDEKNGIGIKGRLPWNLKKDLKFFQKITLQIRDASKQNMVIMGKTTWESLPASRRPLPQRRNIVLAPEREYTADCATVCHSFDEAIRQADEEIDTIFIIGGGSVYRQGMERPDLTGIYLTRIKGDFGCDTFFPPIAGRFKHVRKLGHEKEDGIPFEFMLYTL